jgi:hypothetical protein
MPGASPCIRCGSHRRLPAAAWQQSNHRITTGSLTALLEVLDALTTAEVDDRIRQTAQTIYQALIEAELTSVIGAAPHQRSDTRLTQRNGHRPRVLTTSAVRALDPGVARCGGPPRPGAAGRRADGMQDAARLP